MLLRTHLVITVLLLLILDKLIGMSFTFAIVALFASLIPDLDSADSKYGRKFWILRPIQWLAGHRKFFHSLILPLLICVPIWVFSYSIAYAFLFGYGTHLLADALTIQGVMLFYPFSEKKISGFVSTGGLFEWCICIFGVLVCCWIIL